LKSIYYRIPEDYLEMYHEFGKKSFCIGQAAIVDLNEFLAEDESTFEPNVTHRSLKKLGYSSEILAPILNDETIKVLSNISDNWKATHPDEEILFTHGTFSEIDIKSQNVLIAKDSKDRIVAFLNIIEPFADKIPSFDLLRFSEKAPSEISVFLIFELLKYFKNRGFSYVNIGFAPMSGLAVPQSFPERSIKFAYEKISSLSHFKGLREKLEKFKPQWKNQYLVYDDDFDLLQVPTVLNKVFKPV
jgi:phosphatidylglycerol lysyltransferase